MCDENAAVFSKLFKEADISHNRLIRTTDKDHYSAVQRFWGELKGSIGKGTHTGLYSTNEETFVVEKDLNKCDQGFRTQAGELVEQVSESNYVFNISAKDRETVYKWASSGTSIAP